MVRPARGSTSVGGSILIRAEARRLLAPWYGRATPEDSSHERAVTSSRPSLFVQSTSGIEDGAPAFVLVVAAEVRRKDGPEEVVLCGRDPLDLNGDCLAGRGLRDEAGFRLAKRQGRRYGRLRQHNLSPTKDLVDVIQHDHARGVAGFIPEGDGARFVRPDGALAEYPEGEKEGPQKALRCACGR